eukprot:s1296_g20.t1
MVKTHLGFPVGGVQELEVLEAKHLEEQQLQRLRQQRQEHMSMLNAQRERTLQAEGERRELLRRWRMEAEEDAQRFHEEEAAKKQRTFETRRQFDEERREQMAIAKQRQEERQKASLEGVDLEFFGPKWPQLLILSRRLARCAGGAMMDATKCQGRATISGDIYQINGKEVVLMGGNYVLKAQPYYPPLEVVRDNAKEMFQGAQNMAFVPPPASDGAARPVVPCVRLGAMMEAALLEKGGTIDETFKTTLESVVKTFQEEGVYVFLDIHQDACSTTNGGEGYPLATPALLLFVQLRGQPVQSEHRDV